MDQRLPEWIKEEGGFFMIHPDDWELVNADQRFLFHILDVEVFTDKNLERGNAYFMRKDKKIPKDSWSPSLN